MMLSGVELVFALGSVLPIFSSALVASPCSLAEVFINKFGQNKAEAANWACLAKHASGFNTQAIGETHRDGSDDFGIFQINDKYCRRGTKTSCGVSCTDLVSNDIVPSASCAMSIYKKEGFAHWPAWKNNCKGHDVSRFIDKCEVRPKG
uniref:lysozyme n=1 Tax=Latrodectus hesperus TaxID=256737 RepID=E7D1P2_LATHE|nr:putative lysozyme precursor [Latrodectus hesperus]